MTSDDLRPIIFVLVVASGLMLAVGLAIWYELRRLRRDMRKKNNEKMA